ncbi:MerR family transcriptional regulator [Priestia aryabhattai]|uniref:MerR family transcriptional regulator n=1 Tax=Priestia aryabhattai TaxID=412384 RepID=UPI0018768543|nr:MerR family transcriptional regulator [Priestia aryabhattai]MBE5102213.1 MerR family transcriptional regulator [Priestia aryabhattai]
MLRVITAEAAYTTEELADILGLPLSTIRKYNFHFAKIGVQFTKNQGRLAYTNDDVTIFHELKRMYAHPEMTLEKSVITVAKKFNLVPDAPPNISTEKQTLSLEPLEVQMKEIQNYIDAKFEQRERQLISMAREIRALKKAQQQKKSVYKWLKTFFEK